MKLIIMLNYIKASKGGKQRYVVSREERKTIRAFR